MALLAFMVAGAVAAAARVGAAVRHITARAAEAFMALADALLSVAARCNLEAVSVQAASSTER